MRTVAPSTPSITRAGWALSCLGLVALVVVVIGLGDARVFSGSDAGGKAATVLSIAEHGTGGVDLGYWAEAHDAEGVHHPLINTSARETGWIQVTSAAMPTASSLGERVGGAIGALWLSMFAVPVGALGAARLSRRLGAPTGYLTFLVVGAASPLAFYGADQWEHAPALAAGIWAVALLGEKLDGRQFAWLGLAAGVAGALRRETMIVLIVLGMVELLDRDRRRFWLSHLPGVAVAGSATFGVLAVVYRLDATLLGKSLSSRSASQAGRVGSEPLERLSDGVLTTVSQYSNLSLPWALIGFLTLVGVALSASGWVRGEDEHVRMGAMMVAASLVIRVLVGGLTFVPGAFAALPVAAAAPFLAARRERPMIVGCGVAVVAVVMLQWTGSLGAQWGGRYLLLPAAVVAIVALSGIERRDPRHPAALVAIGATVAIAGLGLVWHIERSNSVGEGRDVVLASAAGEVVISTHPHFPREIATNLAGERWLKATSIDEVDAAFAVAAAAAPGENVWLLHPGNGCDDTECSDRWDQRDGAATPDGWRSDTMIDVPWLSGATYVLEGFRPD